MDQFYFFEFDTKWTKNFSENKELKCCIIGAGPTGLSTAILLAAFFIQSNHKGKLLKFLDLNCPDLIPIENQKLIKLF